MFKDPTYDGDGSPWQLTQLAVLDGEWQLLPQWYRLLTLQSQGHHVLHILLDTVT